jgi:hypothetical protein
MAPPALGTPHALRPVLIISVVLLAIGGWASSWESGAAESRVPQGRQWRRTIEGWQTTDTWQPPRPAASPPLHPLTLACSLALFSALALVALSPAAPSATPKL